MKELKPFVVDTRLEEYMKSSNWKGKIFMQDEKTCFKDGFSDGFNMAYKELELFEKENEKLRQQIEKMKNCKNCKYFVDVDNVCNQGLYLGNRNFTECYEWELTE